MRRVLTILGFLALAAGIALPAAAWVLDRFVAVDVQIIAPVDAETVRINRGLWMEGDPVVDIYGVPAGKPTRVLFPDGEAIIRPQEDPDLTLLAVDKQAGDNPLQVKTVWFFAWRALIGFGLAGALLLGSSRFFRVHRPAS